MPTRNINLTDAQDQYVQEMVDAGEYQNASEAMRDAIRALQQRRRESEIRLEALQAELKLGLDQLDRGEFVEINGAKELRRFFEKVKPAPARRRKRR